MSAVPVNVQLTAVLKDNTGAALQGASIAFSFKLSSAAAFTSGGSAVTDSTGTATLTLSLLAPEVYDFDASFNGSSMFAASSVAIVFDTTAPVSQTQMTVQVTPQNATSANVTGTLTSSGVPVIGAVISIAVDGSPVGNAATDGAGNYSFQLTSLAPGGHTLKVSFAGSGIFAPSSATSTFGGGTGSGPGGPSLVAAAAVATLAIAGAYAFMTRKKKR